MIASTITHCITPLVQVFIMNVSILEDCVVRVTMTEYDSLYLTRCITALYCECLYIGRLCYTGKSMKAATVAHGVTPLH